MTPDEAAKIFYNSARAELIEHIKLRDTVLLLYLGAITTIMGISLGTNASVEILLVAPFLSLGASLIVAQHHISIGSLASYCVNEIGAYINTHNLVGHPAQWDNSIAIETHSKEEILRRSWGHLLILLAPSLFALGINYTACLKPFPSGIIWWFGVVSTVLTCYFIVWAHFKRYSIFREIFEKKIKY